MNAIRRMECICSSEQTDNNKRKRRMLIAQELHPKMFLNDGEISKKFKCDKCNIISLCEIFANFHEISSSISLSVLPIFSSFGYSDFSFINFITIFCFSIGDQFIRFSFIYLFFKFKKYF